MLTRAVMIGAIAAIGVPFAVGGSTAPVARLVAMMPIHGPHGTTLPWSWPIFCVVTLGAWGLLYFARD